MASLQNAMTSPAATLYAGTRHRNERILSDESEPHEHAPELASSEGAIPQIGLSNLAGVDPIFFRVDVRQER